MPAFYSHYNLETNFILYLLSCLISNRIFDLSDIQVFKIFEKLKNNIQNRRHLTNEIGHMNANDTPFEMLIYMTIGYPTNETSLCSKIKKSKSLSWIQQWHKHW